MFRCSFHSDNMSPQLFARNLVSLPNRCNDLFGEHRIIIYGWTQATLLASTFILDGFFVGVVVNNSSVNTSPIS